MKNEQNYRQRSLKLYEFCKKLTPPGIEIGTEIRNYFIGLFVTATLSFFDFIGKYNEVYSELAYGFDRTDFWEILRGSLSIFSLLGLWMVAVAVGYYMYYYRESKSIYLMKRLPSRWEIHKRSLTFPFIATVITLISTFLMMIVYFAIYMFVSPQQCVAPGQW